MKKFFLVFWAVWRAKGRRHKGALERERRVACRRSFVHFFMWFGWVEWVEGVEVAEVPNYIDHQSILQRKYQSTMIIIVNSEIFSSLRDRRGRVEMEDLVSCWLSLKCCRVLLLSIVALLSISVVFFSQGQKSQYLEEYYYTIK